MKYDLHVHTNFSDGTFSSAEVVDLAMEKGLTGIGITDHDTIDGIESAIKHSKIYNFVIIPGIEFSSIYENEEVHILGYFIDYKNDELLNTINLLLNSRYDRAVKIIKRLNDIGISITMEDVLQSAINSNIGRPHIAKVLVKKKVVASIQEAFDLYLERGKQAYFERYFLKINEAIGLIHKIGGIAILAHPGLLKNKNIIQYVISCGIDGIECIHSKHSSKEIKLFKSIANENDLLVTGGSDFHGELDILGDYYIDEKTLKAMKERSFNV